MRRILTAAANASAFSGARSRQRSIAAMSALVARPDNIRVSQLKACDCADERSSPRALSSLARSDEPWKDFIVYSVAKELPHALSGVRALSHKRMAVRYWEALFLA